MEESWRRTVPELLSSLGVLVAKSETQKSPSELTATSLTELKPV